MDLKTKWQKDTRHWTSSRNNKKNSFDHNFDSNMKIKEIQITIRKWQCQIHD